MAASAAAAAAATRVLIVEDDRDASDALAYALLLGGFTVECAPTVGQALLLLERGIVPDVVVLDLRLPDASGGLLLRRVRRDGLRTKVAVVTGVDDPFTDQYVRRFAPDRIFKKPLEHAALVEWLRSVG